MALPKAFTRFFLSAAAAVVLLPCACASLAEFSKANACSGQKAPCCESQGAAHASWMGQETLPTAQATEVHPSLAFVDFFNFEQPRFSFRVPASFSFEVESPPLRLKKTTILLI